ARHPTVIVLPSTPHAPPPSAFPYTTLFRSSCRHISPTRARAASAVAVSSSISITLPTRRSLTSVNPRPASAFWTAAPWTSRIPRSEEHTSELQSRFDIVCRLLLEKKNVTLD